MGVVDLEFEGDVLRGHPSGVAVGCSGNALSYRYVGALGVRWDAATGLYYMRQRWYDPGLGRFLSRDILRTINRYAYCSNKPTSFIDPLGLQDCPCPDTSSKVPNPLVPFQGLPMGYPTVFPGIDARVKGLPPSPDLPLVGNLFIGPYITLSTGTGAEVGGEYSLGVTYGGATSANSGLGSYQFGGIFSGVSGPQYGFQASAGVLLGIEEDGVQTYTNYSLPLLPIGGFTAEDMYGHVIGGGIDIGENLLTPCKGYTNKMKVIAEGPISIPPAPQLHRNAGAMSRLGPAPVDYPKWAPASIPPHP